MGDNPDAIDIMLWNLPLGVDQDICRAVSETIQTEFPWTRAIQLVGHSNHDQDDTNMLLAFLESLEYRVTFRPDPTGRHVMIYDGKSNSTKRESVYDLRTLLGRDDLVYYNRPNRRRYDF